MKKKTNYEPFMRQALGKAREGIKRGQTPFGACVVKGTKIISCAHNVVWRDTDITAHAEITALRQACKRLGTIDLSGCVMVSTCEPCPMCYSACHWARISTVVFGARIKDARAYGFNELMIANTALKRLSRSPLVIIGDCLRDDAIRLFESWAARRDKRVY